MICSICGKRFNKPSIQYEEMRESIEKQNLCSCECYLQHCSNLCTEVDEFINNVKSQPTKLKEAKQYVSDEDRMKWLINYYEKNGKKHKSEESDCIIVKKIKKKKGN